MGQTRDRGDVGDGQQRIRRRLDVEHLYPATQGVLHGAHRGEAAGRLQHRHVDVSAAAYRDHLGDRYFGSVELREALAALEDHIDAPLGLGAVACLHYPELLTQVREGLRKVRAMQAQVSALFPEAGAEDFDVD